MAQPSRPSSLSTVQRQQNSASQKHSQPQQMPVYAKVHKYQNSNGQNASVNSGQHQPSPDPWSGRGKGPSSLAEQLKQVQCLSFSNFQK